jgi:hypothetical protein
VFDACRNSLLQGARCDSRREYSGVEVGYLSLASESKRATFPLHAPSPSNAAKRGGVRAHKGENDPKDPLLRHMDGCKMSRTTIIWPVSRKSIT